MKNIAILILNILLISVAAKAQTPSIDEGKFISIGGIEQWVTIQGEDSTKPAILFLHGGPGSVMSPYKAIFDDLNKDFVLVNWDQRGAGRTFGHLAPTQVDEAYWKAHPLTLEQMTADGLELSEYLIRHLGKKKIILVGTSWGSVLGVKMALARPDLFYAYIGHSQLTNFLANLQDAYAQVYKMAKSAEDKESVDKLETLGPPPYTDVQSPGQVLRIIKKYERNNSVPAPKWPMAPEYDNEVDENDRYNGEDYSWLYFIGHNGLGIEGMNHHIDFTKEVLMFGIPVYFIQGEADILPSKEMTGNFFDKLRAPIKKLVIVPKTAHGHNQAVVDAQNKILREELLPLISE